MRIYAPYARDTAVGPYPALLAIDLYNVVYEGGARPPIEITPQYPSSCGVHAYRAIEPTKRLIAAARRAALPIFFCTQDIRSNARPAGDCVANVSRCKTDRRQQCHGKCGRPDQPSDGRCRPQLVMPQLSRCCRHHDREHINREPDGGEEGCGLDGLAE